MRHLHSGHRDDLRVQDVDTHALLWRRLTDQRHVEQHQTAKPLSRTLSAAAAMGLPQQARRASGSCVLPSKLAAASALVVLVLAARMPTARAGLTVQESPPPPPGFDASPPLPDPIPPLPSWVGGS